MVQPQRQNLKKAFSASPELLPRFKRAIGRSLTLWPDTVTEKMDVVPVLHRMVFNAVMVCMAGDDVEVEESNTLFQACSECLVHFQGRYSKPMFDEHITKERNTTPPLPKAEHSAHYTPSNATLIIIYR